MKIEGKLRKTDDRIRRLEILSIRRSTLEGQITTMGSEIITKLKEAISKYKDREDVGIIEYSKTHMDAIAYWLYQYKLLIDFQKHRRDMNLTRVNIDAEKIYQNEEKIKELCETFNIELP